MQQKDWPVIFKQFMASPTTEIWRYLFKTYGKGYGHTNAAWQNNDLRYLTGIPTFIRSLVVTFLCFFAALVSKHNMQLPFDWVVKVDTDSFVRPSTVGLHLLANVNFHAKTRHATHMKSKALY
jgi:hypothetical protein